MRSRGVSLFLILLAPQFLLAQPVGSVRGSVTDQTGSVIPGANVTLSGNGIERTVSANETGSYAFTAVPDGTYTLRVNVYGFQPYENRSVVVSGGHALSVNAALTIQAAKQEVTVAAEPLTTVSVDPSQNVGALMLQKDDIDALRSAPAGRMGGGGFSGGSGFGGGFGRGSRGGSRSGGFDALTDHRFNLTLSISARNLLNTVNPGTPIGNLGSPLFGESNQIAGGFGPTGQSADNRRMEL